MRDYKKLQCYELADQLVLKVYILTKAFLKDELYGLVSQLRRAAVSVASNIVEGASRHSQKEFLQFLYLSRGSAAELEYLLSLAKKLGYLKAEAAASVSDQANKTLRTITNLISRVQSDI